MTLRITLLVLVTGLFSLIWTQDQVAPNSPTTEIAATVASSNVAMPVNSKATSRESVVQASQDSWIDEDWGKQQVVELSRGLGRIAGQCRDIWRVSTASPQEIPVKQSRLIGDFELPLPAGVVPGEYRVVSNTGIVRDLALSMQDLQSPIGRDREFATRDIYVIEHEDVRWYFIRVRTRADGFAPMIAGHGVFPVAPAIAEAGIAMQLPAVAEREDSSSIRRAASLMIIESGRKICRGVIRSAESGMGIPNVIDSLRSITPPVRMSSQPSSRKSR